MIFDSTYVDENGLALLLSDNVLDVLVVDLIGSSFWSPDSAFNGYGADGNKYLAGEATVDRASWASEVQSAHRGPHNRFPQKFIVVLTDREVSLIDASDYSLFLRVVASEVPSFAAPAENGIFLEWVADEAVSSAGSALGFIGNTFYRLGWGAGRLSIVTDSGTRVIDFKADQCFLFHDAGHYRANLSYQKGVAFRNGSHYFSTSNQPDPIGVTDSLCTASIVIGTSVYFVFGTAAPGGSPGGVVVYRWTGPSEIGGELVIDLTVDIVDRLTSLSGTPLDVLITTECVLYLLLRYNDGVQDRLRVVRSISEWQTPSGGGFSEGSPIDLPVQAGGAGRLEIRGSDLLIAGESGVWSIDIDTFQSPEYTYGSTSSTVEPLAPKYDLLVSDAQPILDLQVDRTTGHLGVVHGDYLEIIDVGRQTISARYTQASDTPIPSAPVTLTTFLSFAIGGSDGLGIITTAAVSVSEYDPVVRGQDELDGRLFYEILPDTFSLLADYDLLPRIWEGYVQLGADLFQSLLSADASRSLLDVPIDYQQKYQHFDLDFPKTFLADPGLSFYGLGYRAFQVDTTNQVLDCCWTTKLDTEKSYWLLRSQLDYRSSLRWSWTASYSQFDEGSYGLLGYLSTDASAIENSLLVGVGNSGRVGILHVSPTGAPNFVETPPVVSVDTEVEIEVTYDSSTSTVAVTVTEADSGVEVLSAYTYALLSGPSSEDFYSDSFGFVNLNVSRTDLTTSPTFTPKVGQMVLGTVSAVSFLDASLPADIQAIPFLQDSWREPSVFWTESVDYSHYYDEEAGWSFIAFQEQPEAFLLAEYVSYNQSLIKNNFGLDVDFSGPNTVTYKSQVQALHSIYWKGPTIRGIQLGIQVLLGLPFVEEAGEVTIVNPSYSGDFGEIVIIGVSGARAYRYSLAVSPLVTVGDTVEQFQPLTDGVEVRDWVNSPDWFLPFLGDSSSSSSDHFATALNYREPTQVVDSELQKYHMFAVVVLNDIFSVAQLPAIQGFLDAIRQTWKAIVLTVVASIEDDVSIDDELELLMGANIFDHGGGSLVTHPKYDDISGPSSYAYHYDGVPSPLIYYDMFHDLFPDDPIEVILEKVAGAPETIYVNGVATLVTLGDPPITENIP